MFFQERLLEKIGEQLRNSVQGSTKSYKDSWLKVEIYFEELNYELMQEVFPYWVSHVPCHVAGCSGRSCDFFSILA